MAVKYPSDPTQSSHCINWSAAEFQRFGVEPQVSSHGYHQTELFSDSALEQLLDDYPRKWLQCYTMGYDPEKHEEWSPVHIAKRSGKEILAALAKGRMWVNVTNIDKYSGEYAALLADMYAIINANCPQITHAKPSFSALLISSPGVQVYCHVDADANMLWHLKGRKRVWVYPANDRRFTPQTYIEEIIGEERHENIPYERWYDDHAFAHELLPGEVVSWPQHSPHRVENVDFNVSLTTSYGSRESRQRIGVHGANHHFLKPLGFRNRGTGHVGMIAAVKMYSYYIAKKLGFIKPGNRTASYESALELDPSHPQGMSELSEKTLPAFAFTE